MTISTTYAPDNYAGNGSTTVFAITFEFLSTSTNVKVSLKNDSTGVITEQSSPSQYSISGSNVTMVTAPASGETLILELNPDFKQQSDYRENDEFPAETLETDLDERTLEGQINNDLVSRALRADASVDLTGKTLSLDFPSSGTEVVTITSTSIGRSSAFSLGAITLTGTTEVAVSGTAGTSGDLSVWDANGNLVDGPTPPSGTIIGTTDTQTLTNKTLDADNNTVTNIGASEVNSNIVRGQTATTAVAGDYFLYADASDGDNLKQATLQDIATLTINQVPSASDSAEGTIEIATQSEMEADSSTTLAVTPGRQKYHPSAVKGWCEINGGGSELQSYNVSSVTDNGAGDYTVNWSTSLSGANHTYFTGVRTDSALTAAVSNSTTGASAARLVIRNTSGTLVDPNGSFVGAVGDFA